MRRALVLLVLLALPAFSMAADIAVTGVRLGENAGQTRLVLDLTGAVEFSATDEADQLLLDLPALDWRAPKEGSGRGLIRAYRLVGQTPSGTKLAIAHAPAARLLQATLLPPGDGRAYRLVIDLAPEKIVPPDDYATLPATVRPLAKPRLQRVIAIDAGHGGVDPGAIGINGTFEKDITLAIAKFLRSELEATGRYKVVLTRERDEFLRLRARFETARAARADLFISLHADSHKNARLQGASVYTLSETASDAEAAALASRENKADIIGGVDLSHEVPEVADILIDLAQRETLSLSGEFGRGLLGELRKEIKVLRRAQRSADFAVLKAPDIPSVLLELGYLSNRFDDERLKSETQRKKIARSLIKALDAHFARAEKLSRS